MSQEKLRLRGTEPLEPPNPDRSQAVHRVLPAAANRLSGVPGLPREPKHRLLVALQHRPSRVGSFPPITFVAFTFREAP